MGDSSDISVTSEYLNESVSSDLSDEQPIKQVKISSPAVTPKLDNKLLHHGKSVTIINSPNMSRASSSMSLASSMAVEDVRHLSSNYEQLLQQATASIKKLTKEKKN